MTIVGIDLGTTNSLVTVLQDGAPRTLANEHGEHLLPSAVAVAADGGLLVGRAAWDRLIVAPDAGRAFFKRDMGTARAYGFGGRRWTPVECSALVLAELRRIARLQLGRPVDRAVITVPAYFRENQRQATVEAAHLAGLSVARILNEPTAAALAHGYRAPAHPERLLVFDLGGGTFDVTALELFEGVVEVRASGGESHLGGEDYTDALLAQLLQRCGLQPPPAAMGRLRASVELVKRRLSVQPSAGIVLDGHELVATRHDLEQSGNALTARIRPLVARCLREAGFTAAGLDAVLPVGGASRMHMIGELLQQELGRPPLTGVDPDRAVALGAAVQAALCEGDAAVGDLVLTDVCAHTLGIETSKELVPGQVTTGYFSPIIDRNTTVPVSRSQVFHTFAPEQDVIQIQVFQGEARLTKDNQRLGRLVVHGLRRPPPECGEVEVRFTYDMSGLLEVDVTVLHSGARFQAVLEERPGLLSAAQMREIRERLAPLKVVPRDKPHNRARLERAARVYTQLLGDERARLDQLLEQFEAALAQGDEAGWEAVGAQLDAFLAGLRLGDGEWQPEPDQPEPGD